MQHAVALPQPTAKPDSTNSKRLARRLLRIVGKTIIDYDMLRDGDRVMVAVSGGKDSYTLLHLLMTLQERAPVRFSLLAVNLDQKQPGFPAEVLPRYFASVRVPYQIVTKDTYRIVTEKVPGDATMCGLCSRLRRGILYNAARDHNCNVLALGHHADDLLETFFLNLFYGGKLATMPPSYVNDAGDIRVIRPLAQCFEKDIARFARSMAFPIIPCNLCGSQPDLKRQAVKQMIADWSVSDPHRRNVMLQALGNWDASRLLRSKDHHISAHTARHPAKLRSSLCGSDSIGDVTSSNNPYE